MKRRAIFLLLILQGMMLHGEPVTGQPMTTGLRVRTGPGLEAKVLASLDAAEEVLVLSRSEEPATIDGMRGYWLKVVRMDRTVGWTFGGYLILSVPLARTLPVDDGTAPKIAVKDYGGALGDGTVVLMRVTAAGSLQENIPLSEISVMFYRTGGSAPRIAFALPTGTDRTTGDISCTIAGVDFKDVIGDPRREAALTILWGGPDGGQSELSLLGMAAGGDRLLPFGSIVLHEGGTGGGCGDEENNVTSGPAPVGEGRERVIMLVRVATSYGSQCEKIVTTTEETYALDVTLLRMKESRVLASTTIFPPGYEPREEH